MLDLEECRCLTMNILMEPNDQAGKRLWGRVALLPEEFLPMHGMKLIRI